MFQNFFSQRLFDLKCFEDYPVGDKGWRYTRELSKVRKLIVHHVAAKGNKEWKRDVDMVYNFHKSRGWKGIGYHFLITSEIRNGYAVVAYVGNINTVRAHDPNEKNQGWSPRNRGNEYSIGISFVNDHSKYQLIEQQLKSARILIEDLMLDGRFSASTWDDVLGHGYSSYTWCPDGNLGNTITPYIQNAKIDLPINNNQMDINYDILIPEAQEWDKLVKEKRLVPGQFKDLTSLIAKIVNEGQDFGSQITNDLETPAKQKIRALLKEVTDTYLDNKSTFKKEEMLIMLLRFFVYFELSPKINEEFNF